MFVRQVREMPCEEEEEEEENIPGEGAGDEGEGGEGGQAPKAPTPISDDMQIEVNGEKLTVAELKAGHMRQSDYTKKSQELAEERKKLEGDRPPKDKPAKDGGIPEEDRKTARYLLKIAMEDPELKKEFGLVTEKDLATRDIVKDLSRQSEDLQKEFDGKNGLPKFSEKEVLEHMQEEGFRSMRKAYFDMIQDKPEYVEYLVKLKKGSTAYRSEGKGAPITRKKEEFNVRTPDGLKAKAASLLEDVLGGKEE